MKVALINPAFAFPDRKSIAASHCLGLRSISAALKAAGHEVDFIDALRLGFDTIAEYPGGILVGEPIDVTAARIADDTKLVGISVPFSQLAPVAHQLVSAIKARRPDVTVVLGGVYPSTQPTLALSGDADFIVVGEGERALCDLAAGVDPIPGVFRPSDTGSDLFACAMAVDNLDTLGRPDDDIPDMAWYWSHAPRGMTRQPTVSMITSRGCPFACEFCSVHPVYGRNWRAMSADRVLDDVAYWSAAHGAEVIEIEDDNFTLDAARAKAILEGFVRMRAGGRTIAWRAPNGVRLDTLDDELIELTVQSGCRDITVALEHGDAEMLDIMRKKLDLQTAESVIEKLAAAGLAQITVFVIVGYPGETRARFERSLAFLRRLRTIQRHPQQIVPCINIAQPYPGTELLARCRREGIIDDPAFGNFLERPKLLTTASTVAIETEDFDAAEVTRRRSEILRALPDVGSVSRVVRRLRHMVRCVIGTSHQLGTPGYAEYD